MKMGNPEGSLTMHYSNSVITTITCTDHGHDHDFFADDTAPSQALHDALVLVPCDGDFEVAMTVLDRPVQSSNTTRKGQ